MRALVMGGFVLTGVVLVWLLFVVLPRSYGGRGDDASSTAAAPANGAPAAAGRKINVRLFYVAESGTALASVEREVAFAENTTEQAKAIVAAQIAPVEPPLVSAIPGGTALRALFVTDAGEAYVDVSRELMSGHSGGSMAEMLTIYTLVDALTVNLPAVRSVQILVDGKEIETLAGHVDIRRPLLRNDFAAPAPAPTEEEADKVQ
jgi:spore germination protein GerM